MNLIWQLFRGKIIYCPYLHFVCDPMTGCVCIFYKKKLVMVIATLFSEGRRNILPRMNAVKYYNKLKVVLMLITVGFEKLSAAVRDDQSTAGKMAVFLTFLEGIRTHILPTRSQSLDRCTKADLWQKEFFFRLKTDGRFHTFVNCKSHPKLFTNSYLP